MASIVYKLACAAVATRASPAAIRDIAGGSRSKSPYLPRLYLTGSAIRPMCSGVSPAGGSISEEEQGRPKSEEAINAAMIDSEDSEDCLDVNEDSLKSKEALWALYEYWRKYHEISREPDEMARRFKIFSNSARRVYKANNSNLPYKLRLNQFADQTTQEMFGSGCASKR